MNHRKCFTVLLGCAAVLSNLRAQNDNTLVVRPSVPVIVRPYTAPFAPPVRLNNSSRLLGLIRAGKLYLTVQDAIALAIENNLDLEVDRYGPVLAEWALQRAQAGGVLRGVTSGSSQVGQTASGQGISGSQKSAGIYTSYGGVSSGSAGAVVSQIGPVTANLDPVVQNTTLFSHTTTPQVNTIQSETPSLIDTSHIYNSSLQQGLITGGYIQLIQDESYLKENTPTDVLNPSVAPRLQLYLQHSLLSGFGVGVNSRFIRVAEKNRNASQDTFRSQLLNIVANVLNLYWDLVADNEDLQARRRARDVADKFYADTKKQVELGVIARVEVYPAQAEAATRDREFVIGQTAVRLQETLLKNALSRNGLQDPVIDNAEIVPLDRIQVPPSDDLPPLRDLVAKATLNRPDISVSNVNLESSQISALGTANGLLPQLTGFATTYNLGLAGKPVPQPDGEVPDPYFVGGFGKAMGQVLRRDFRNNSEGAILQGPLHNRINQGDYGVDQLQLRQAQLNNRRDLNQMVVDISSQTVALRQARARYSTAVDARVLQEQLLDKTNQSFQLGSATLNDIIVSQRSLAAAEYAEVAALSAYSHARIALDQILGNTLTANNVSVTEAEAGHVKRLSALPADVPSTNK